MSTDERSGGRRPMYARLLRLRRIRITGLVSFLLMECTIAVAVLLALAELVSWWAVPLLPVLVAAVVKINDMVGGPPARTSDTRMGGRLDTEAPAAEAVAGWDEELAVDERSWLAEHTAPASSAAGTEDLTGWYADDATQEIHLPPALTGRPRQRSVGAADGYESRSAPASGGYADSDTAEVTYAGLSHEQAFAPAGQGQRGQGQRGQGQRSQGQRGWGRHAASGSVDRQPAGTSGAQGDRQPGGGAGGASRPVDYWSRSAGTDGRTTGASRGTGGTGGDRTGAAGGSAPPANVPGSAAPRRAQLFGAAVRRSMAAQAQQIGTAPTGRSGRATGNADTGSGRHARGGESGGTGGRQTVRLNERGFGRLRDA